DMLISTAVTAAAGDEAFREGMARITLRHHDIIDEVITDHPDTLKTQVDSLLDELASIYHGLFLIRDLSPKTQALIVSYGERLSSLIVNRLVSGSVLHDSRRFIKTESKHHRTLLATELTDELVRAEFSGPDYEGHIHIVPGFISTDAATGEVTNLGRGGSDYTASIIAAALDAEVLEIWTDVDGFMTADPRVIPTAYTINALSYVEAMELCNFGAKVVYPPTIYPVCVKNIPILVKNTFHPEAAGSVIRNVIEDDRKPIKGISSINGTSLITVAGLSMVGVIGVNRRIFTALADNGISVFMVSQASSENSTSVGVRDEDAAEAVRVLDNEFAKEIRTGAMFPMHAESGLATVAIVGENMKHTPGIAGKLFGALGRSGISVIACAQGASETNISFVVNGSSLRKS
ncbi:MAG: aspartate kinase, partial [Duncaniella sp.]|nr:aspartate kinase [Duncaniella sp.]